MTTLVLALLAAAPALTWKPLAEGVELTTVQMDAKPAYADGNMQVVRINPQKARLEFGLASKDGGGKRTAGEWSDQKGFVAAINAGMFDVDQKSNVGLLVDGAHKNNPRWHKDYKSVLAFGPNKKGIPAAVFVDLDDPAAKETLGDYVSVVQNLRLVKSGGESVWKPNKRRWSEAAIALDTQGRVLFLFLRSPMEMAAFNARLKEVPLDITRAMHVEGGPEASLSIRSGGTKVDLCGSYETSFVENDQNKEQWAIPNVLGVRRSN
jgi:hypothetical protein